MPTYDVWFDVDKINGQRSGTFDVKSVEADKGGAKASRKPTKKDVFIPQKKWDKKKGKSSEPDQESDSEAQRNAASNSANTEPAKEKTPTRIEFSESDIPHIFRNKKGHLPDTPSNRELLLDTANDIRNFLGLDKYRSLWYGKILSDGKHAWVVVRDGFVRYAGLNDTPHIFNNQTGFSRNLNS